MAKLFLSLLGTSVSISAVVVILMLLTPFLNKRYAAKWKCSIWIFLAVWLIIPFKGDARQFVLAMLPQTETQPTLMDKEKLTDTQVGAIMPSRQVIVEIPAQMTAPIAMQAEKSNISISILDAVAFVWMIGYLVFILVHLISYFRFRGEVIRRGTIIRDTNILRQMSELKDELHIKGKIQMIEYPEADSPMVIGFLKPVLVLPKEQYSPEELFFILKHELVHLKRGDVYFKLLFITANAVHWFNPLIWVMQKEAAVDMELSCDERVTQGTGYAVRKAYTETLLSMLHKQCTKRTVLSTQFYGGTKIMKKRFKNILVRKGKKNGISILVCAVILTVSLGTLVGYSIAKEDTRNKDTGNELAQQGRKDTQTKQMPANYPSAADQTLENKTKLIFSKEGQEEQKQATLAVGEGYSIYLPDDEWQKSGSDMWTAAVNKQVRLWITHFKMATVDSVKLELEKEGYMAVQGYDKRKKEGDLVYHARLKPFENDVWGIFYCYPTDSEEGWGRELPVIADTFALSVGTHNEKPVPVTVSNPTDLKDTGEYLQAKDCQKIQNIAGKFAAAYFNGNTGILQKYLTSTYEGEAEIYEGTGTVSDLTVKGLSDTDEKKLKNGIYVVSLEFRDSNYKDSLFYLTLGFAKEEESWKIQFYGVEG